MPSLFMHVISNTHWDREWRYSFQYTRMMLVEMMDKTLHLLESDPEFKYFHLDSQTSIVEDYLQIRPENEERIRRLVQAGRLFMGPWFCLPDQFLVGGESLVRNLLLGHKIASRFGSAMKVGYSPFSWGQISQLPQIYAEFGIDTALFYRGVSRTDTGRSEFIWEGADGTRALASRFSKIPRANFWYQVYRPVVFNRAWGVDDREFKWEMPGAAFRFCDATHYRRDYKLADPPDEYHADRLLSSLVNLRDAGLGDFSTPHLFWSQGHDISAPSHRESQIIRDAKGLLPDAQILHSSLPHYVAQLRDSVHDLAVVKGEMRSVKKDNLSASLAGQVISSRMYIKQKNFACESLLQYYAEPLAVLNWLHGQEYPDGFLSLAWRYLLDNHGHDSIGGCSIDRVHDDMMFRYDQCQEIVNGLIEKNCLFLAGQINFSQSLANDINLVVINPGNYARDDIVHAYVDIPQDWSGSYAIDPVSPTLRMQDDEGNIVPLQELSEKAELPVLQQAIDSPLFLRMIRRHFCFAGGALPAFGYRCYKLAACENLGRNNGSLSPQMNQLENEHLLVSINSNGTWNVLDKVRQIEYRDLGSLWDGGEVGDPWTHVAPQQDQIFTSTTLSARTSLEKDGPLLCQYGIHLALELPKSSGADGQCRSTDVNVLQVKHTLTLTRNSKRLDVMTEIDNSCQDHWLRLVFPTDVCTETVHVEGQFDVLARKIPRTEDTRFWPEPPLYCQPMNSFVDFSDVQRGIAFINYGLKEYEALDDRRRTFMLTCLRAFPLKIGGVGMQDYSQEQKGSQCLGMQRLFYAIYPHAGDWEKGEVFKQTFIHNQQLTIFQVGKNHGTWPHQLSFLKLEPESLVITAVKKAEQDQAFIVRFFNPGEQMISGILHVASHFTSAHYVTLEEKIISTCNISAGKIHVAAGSKKIVTVKIYF